MMDTGNRPEYRSLVNGFKGFKGLNGINSLVINY